MSTTEKAAPADGRRKKGTPMTSYVVLVQAAEGGPWHIAHAKGAANPLIGATSAEYAMKGYLSVAEDAPYALVAVPARSWQPVKPKTTTKTITTLEAL